MGQLGQLLLWDSAGWPEVHRDMLDGFAAYASCWMNSC